jgi:hypothetical protein
VIADGYLVKASSTSLESIAAPVDGTDPGEGDANLADGSAEVKIDYGTTTYSFTGLSEGTTYYFKIYPYTNSGTDIVFKTDGTIPTASATTDDVPITLVITEINDPVDHGEFSYIEIYNTTSSAINIQGYTIYQYGNPRTTVFNSENSDLTIKKEDSTEVSTSGDILIPAKGFLLLIEGSKENIPITTFEGGSYYNRAIDDEVLFAWDGGGAGSDNVPDIQDSASFVLTDSSGTTIDKSSAGTENQIKVNGILTAFLAEKRYERIGVESYNWAMHTGDFTNATPGAISTDNQNDSSLPVELTDFAAVAQSGGVVLSWTTESETENLGFIVQRQLRVSSCELPARMTRSGGRVTDWEEIASYTTSDALTGHGSTSEAHEYSYTDAAVVPGATYLYRLGDVDYSGKVTLHKEVEVKVEVEDEKVPVVFGLKPAFPNPFNPSLTIPYGLTEDGNMSLKVYNLRGELVKVLISTYALKGTYSLNWNPQNLSAGIYFIRMQSGNRTAMQKVVFVK